MKLNSQTYHYTCHVYCFVVTDTSTLEVGTINDTSLFVSWTSSYARYNGSAFLPTIQLEIRPLLSPAEVRIFTVPISQERIAICDLMPHLVYLVSLPASHFIPVPVTTREGTSIVSLKSFVLQKHVAFFFAVHQRIVLMTKFSKMQRIHVIGQQKHLMQAKTIKKNALIFSFLPFLRCDYMYFLQA